MLPLRGFVLPTSFHIFTRNSVLTHTLEAAPFLNRTVSSFSAKCQDYLQLGTFFFRDPYLSSERRISARSIVESQGETPMEGLTGLAAVVMFLGMPVAILAMYTFYRVRKLRADERMAAMARGVTVPMAEELSEAARSRRSGILLIASAVGYMLTFTLIARIEPDAWIAAAFGAIPLSLGLGYFLDSALIRRDARA
jgi:hypothetical protein